MARVLIPLPNADFDPTEVVVPWRILRESGHEVVFATPDGRVAEADPRTLRGTGLGPFRFLLQARPSVRSEYARLALDPSFLRPAAYEQVRPDSFHALLLPGGHGPGVKTFLESPVAHAFIAGFFDADKPVAAICHGVVAAARARSTKTGKSVLHGRRTSALPVWMEFFGWILTRLWIGDHYRTYPETVESEVKRALNSPRDFSGGLPLIPSNGFCVVDRNYVSGRWPGDAQRLGEELTRALADFKSRSP